MFLRLVMTQYHVKKGIKVFGDVRIKSVMAKMQQLHDQKIPNPVHPEGSSQKEFNKVLEYLMFLKEKHSGIIKGHGRADGRPQCLYTGKTDSASPTIMTESVLLTAVIEAHEGREVITADILGAFLQEDLDKVIHMVLCGKLAELLIECDLVLYTPFSQQEQGELILYVQLMKELYSCLRATIEFWKKLSAQLVDWGFTINPYDCCVLWKVTS